MTNTLATTERGRTALILNTTPGEYAWHQGAYRRITTINHNAQTIRFAMRSSGVPCAPRLQRVEDRALPSEMVEP